MTWVCIIPFMALLIAFIMGMPIAYGMISGSILYFLIKGLDIGMVAAVMLEKMFVSFIMLAIPLFIFTADLMIESKVTDRIFNFASAIIGKRRGGMGHTNILASLIFSGMSGSAVADVAGLGKMEIKAMMNAGYSEGFSCAITIASATVGPIFPPSIPVVIFCLLSGASVGKLLIGGMLPAILLVVALMIYVSFVAKKRKYPYSAIQGRKEFIKLSLEAIPALFTPIILLGGIYTGIMTPTEAGAAAAFYTLIIGIFFYRTLGLKELFTALKNSTKTIGVVGILIGAAYTFSFIVTYEHIPDIVADFVLSITNNKYVFLLLVNILFLILGMFIDTQTILVVFIPMVLPVVNIFGINLIHFGLVVILNAMIGLSTPPFGMSLFVVSGINNTPLKDIIKEIMPMVYVMVIVLFIITYIPDIVLFLPSFL